MEAKSVVSDPPSLDDTTADDLYLAVGMAWLTLTDQHPRYEDDPDDADALVEGLKRLLRYLPQITF